MKATIDWKAFNDVNALSTNGLMRGESDTLDDEEIALANALLSRARDAMQNVQMIFDAARHNWRNRHLVHRPLLAQTIDGTDDSIYRSLR